MNDLHLMQGTEASTRAATHCPVPEVPHQPYPTPHGSRCAGSLTLSWSNSELMACNCVGWKTSEDVGIYL